MSGTQIEGAVALVTGGNRGFGRALVDELLARGAAKVYATSRTAHPDARRADRPACPRRDRRRIGRRRRKRGARCVDRRQQRGTVHADERAGLAVVRGVRSELETNLFGTIRVARAFAPVLARHDSSAIVNVLSVLSWYAIGRGYEVSKAAAWSATNSIRTRLLEQGTTVTALHVGYMDTDMVADLDVPEDRSARCRGPGRRRDPRRRVRGPRRRPHPLGEVEAGEDITSMYPALAQTVAASAA